MNPDHSISIGGDAIGSVIITSSHNLVIQAQRVMLQAALRLQLRKLLAEDQTLAREVQQILHSQRAAPRPAAEKRLAGGKK